MAKYFAYAFGVEGDRAAVPDPAQLNGAVSWQAGWTTDYQLNPGNDPAARILNRQQTNQMFYDVTTALQQYQQFGVPDFITTADNLGTAFSYSKFARVRYNNGTDIQVYESLIDNNTSLPTVTANWAPVPSPTSSGIPSGAIFDFGGVSAPTDYLLCGGQAVSRSTYAALFTAIGTNFGIGDGSTTFNVPDIRGRVTVGKDDMNGITAGRITNAIAGFVGTQIGASGGNQSMQAHTHTATVTDSGHIHPGGQATNQSAQVVNISGGPGWANSPTNTGSATTGISVSNASTGAGASQNVQPSLIVTKIIKV